MKTPGANLHRSFRSFLFMGLGMVSSFATALAHHKGEHTQGNQGNNNSNSDIPEIDGDGFGLALLAIFGVWVIYNVINRKAESESN